MCEALLEAGARIDETDNEGKAPLALAAQGGHAALVNMFLDKYNAPIDQRPHDGKTALRLAALEGHYEVVQMLITHGADIDSKDADGRSTLYVLALDNRLAMSKYFIQQGADVETRDLEVRSKHRIDSFVSNAFIASGPDSFARLGVARSHRNGLSVADLWQMSSGRLRPRKSYGPAFGQLARSQRHRQVVAGTRGPT